jgi:hypothetical protein
MITSVREPLASDLSGFRFIIYGRNFIHEWLEARSAITLDHLYKMELDTKRIIFNHRIILWATGFALRKHIYTG